MALRIEQYRALGFDFSSEEKDVEVCGVLVENCIEVTLVSKSLSAVEVFVFKNREDANLWNAGGDVKPLQHRKEQTTVVFTFSNSKPIPLTQPDSTELKPTTESGIIKPKRRIEV